MNSSRNKILLFLVGILLLTNIVLVIFFVLKDKPGEKRHMRTDRTAILRGYLKDSVGFDEQQLAQFDQVRERHRESMKPLFEEMQQAKLAFYNLLGQPGTPDSVSQTAADRMSEKQEAVDMAFYRHFQQIRTLCRPEQQARYDSLVQQIVQRMISPRRGDQKRQKELKK